MPDAFASDVLADGRVAVIGGEYNNWTFALTNMGAIYDPQADTWTMLAPPPSTGSPNHFQCIGDAPSTVLADGRLIIGSKLYQDLAILDPATLTWTELPGTGKIDAFNSEEGWTLLPDGSFFTLDVKNAPASERFLLTGPDTGMWVSSGNTPQPLNTAGEVGTAYAPGCPGYNPPGEIGPTPVRPDGTVFAIGADGFTGIYTPPPAGSTAAGTWAEGPAFPGLTVEDGPAAVLPSGHVLFGGSPGDNPGLQYFEFDGQNLISVPAPIDALFDATSDTTLLLLPTGQVLFVDGVLAELYTPAASPTYDPAWAPMIASAPAAVNAGATYQISGTQFNGLDQGTAYGDEDQNATNYPLVRITNNATGHVFYARTHNHSSMGVATGNLAVSTYFDVPADIEAGASNMQVVANGIPSAAVAVTVDVAPGGQAPAVNTGAASGVTVYNATLNGSANPDGADTQVWFEYSTDSTMSGSVSTPKQDIGSGAGAQTFSANLAGLAGLTTYYFRAWAANSAGTSQGSVASFTQLMCANGYSSLGPNGSFSTNAWCINGMSNSDCGPAMAHNAAAPFTPAATFTLQSISLALIYDEGTNSAQISLTQDAGGLPGNVLESWTVNNLPAESPPVLTTVGDTLGLTLEAGQQYWVVAESTAAGTDTLLYWYLSSQGTGALIQFGSLHWVPLFGQLAFEVTGAALPPAVNPGGVVGASAFGEFAAISPGDWIEIYGTNLAPDTREWTASDFQGANAPVELDGTSVTIGGQPAFVSFISPGQVNVQAPFGVGSGPQPLVVTTQGGATSAYTVTVTAAAPGMLAPPSFNIGGNQYAVALFPDYSAYVLPTGAIAGINSRPAQPGDTIILYGVGFGPVTPAIPAGQLVGESNTLAMPFHLFFGGTEAMVSYDGLAPSYVGLYQFNVAVPNVPSGNPVPLTFTLGGSAGTQTLYVAVQ